MVGERKVAHQEAQWVSEFIEEKDGCLALSYEQCEFEVANTDDDVDNQPVLF